MWNTKGKMKSSSLSVYHLLSLTQSMCMDFQKQDCETLKFYKSIISLIQHHLGNTTGIFNTDLKIWRTKPIEDTFFLMQQQINVIKSKCHRTFYWPKNIGNYQVKLNYHGSYIVQDQPSVCWENGANLKKKKEGTTVTNMTKHNIWLAAKKSVIHGSWLNEILDEECNQKSKQACR